MNFVGDANLRLRGCAKVSVTYNYTTKFANRAVAYDCDKSRRGILHRVVIKKAIINKDLYGGPVVIYKDISNEFWTEKELCTQAEAVANAQIYYNQQINDLDNYLNSSCP